MVEVMKIMAPPSAGAMHALLHSVPPTLQQATIDPRLRWRLLDTHNSWTLMGKSGSVYFGVTAPFSWVLVHKVLFVPSKSLFSSPV